MSSYQFLTKIMVEKYEVEAQAIDPNATMADLGLDSLTLTPARHVPQLIDSFALSSWTPLHSRG